MRPFSSVLDKLHSMITERAAGACPVRGPRAAGCGGGATPCFHNLDCSVRAMLLQVWNEDEFSHLYNPLFAVVSLLEAHDDTSETTAFQSHCKDALGQNNFGTL